MVNWACSDISKALCAIEVEILNLFCGLKFTIVIYCAGCFSPGWRVRRGSSKVSGTFGPRVY